MFKHNGEKLKVENSKANIQTQACLDSNAVLCSSSNLTSNILKYGNFSLELIINNNHLNLCGMLLCKTFANTLPNL